GVGGLHRVADVLAVADADMAEEFAFGAVDGLGVAGVRAGLFAADVHLGGAVEGVDLGGAGSRWGGGGFQGGGFCGGFEVGHQALPPAFAPEAGFADTAEACGGVEEVGGVDPDDSGLEFGGDVEGEVDVLGPDRG